MRTMNRFTSEKLIVESYDLLDFGKAWEIQKDYFEKRTENKMGDVLLLMQHPHTYTFGKASDKNNLLLTSEELEERKIKVFEIDRGGDVTYHGPGQLVGYPVLNLSDWHKDAHKYLRALEEVVIETCKAFGLQAGRAEGLTGVWIEDRKICAIGVKITRWVTMHGFALNVNTDLSFFEGIIPCGIKDKSVTSMKAELGGEIDMDRVKDVLVEKFAEVFGYEKIELVKKYER